MEDPRRRIPRTDHLLALPAVRAAAESLSLPVVRGLVRGIQDRARRGEIAPAAVESEVIAAVSARRASSLSPVLNATGVVVHTNLGRAPLSDAARQALAQAAGYVDVELDLATGTRSGRGAAARAALLAACPAAEDALVVNNGAAALVLATTALAAGAEVVVGRGELIEIGAGFRLPDLIASTGARLHEVGTTNRTYPADYAAALGAVTGCVLKVHPSNFRVSGFTAEATITELSGLCREHGVPLVADLGSGLLAPDPVLPEEPDAAGALAAGADLVIASGDKLLGGPQAGLLLGRAELIARLARHPLARAVRADKLTLAALEATLTGGEPPVARALHADPAELRHRAEALAAALRETLPDGPAGDRPGEIGSSAIEVVAHDGRVGGGGGAGVPLPGWAVALPVAAAGPLRTGTPAVLPRVHEGRCLLDLRCIPDSDDARVLAAALSALAGLGAPGTNGAPGTDGAGEPA
ncbi:L-seryl-tRNA(Sec) selenium transferase [Brevibacterium sp. R8603A2]|uniref:L-seryl-tRNA(Sec) selenium transferase n=1 Tax=Brevibacterium sp. R8603A2 TaxID=2929779 RepID=UPI001FFB1C96|nr:L-seryl-tRNA(Sec) selenium transferase [Brevibacterium sp. R8603A2]MCK1801901.1 L-seryl-tRNA(Sec) selenium transferase [Brevibacterium sp. R8603A2]